MESEGDGCFFSSTLKEKDEGLAGCIETVILVSNSFLEVSRNPSLTRIQRCFPRSLRMLPKHFSSCNPALLAAIISAPLESDEIRDACVDFKVDVLP